MPSSPAMRFSPGRETHKRGRSLEGLIPPFREKDDDLALFNEVQSKEKGNFLLQSNDDFDDLFSSKLKYFSDHKLGISIPSRGESSNNLLNGEGEKNDYDWLLTPPDTPLFTSLDDDTPQVNLPIRGRPRTQPISISRSSTMERSHQSSRGSPSPNRMSPSPRSSTSQSRGRPSSLPGTSPPPTRTRRSSPPSIKPSSTPAPRSSTPSPVRTSTGSTETTTTVTPYSIIKSGSRRNSASPKIKAWQANIPGFSTEVPPNLRTSLGDHHRASYVRGSSPASRNGGSKSSRQSMSPTPSRSVGSWHNNSHEGDNNNIPKGSVASSVDDDMDSLMSIPFGSFDHTALKNYRNLNSTKKPTKIAASSSAPKRSIDLTIRQMDHHRKSPHNMFRPLLSSVPSSNAYGSSTKSSATYHRTLTSRNNSSSVTTSSNTSSDMGLSIEHGNKGTEPNHEDLIREHLKLAYPPDMQEEEVFSLEYNLFNEMDITELIVDETRKTNDKETEIEVSVEEGGVFTDNNNNNTTEALCSECGSMFRATEIIEGERYLCKDCKGLGTDFVMTDALEKPVDGVDSSDYSGKSVEDHRLQIPETTKECEISCSKEEVSYCEPHEGEQIQHMINSYTVDEEENNNLRKALNFESYSNPKPDISEGVGIPLLLRSSSGKGSSIVRGRHFAAAMSITIDDFSYMRDSVTSTRSSFGYGGGASASASSSIDLGSSKQSESSVLGRFSSRISDNGNYKSELFVKHQQENFEVSNTLKEIVGPTCDVIEHQELAAHEGDIMEIESNANWRTASDLSNSSMNPSVTTPVLTFQDFDLHGDVVINNQDVTSSSILLENRDHQEVDDVVAAEAEEAEEAAPNPTSSAVISEIEIKEDDVADDVGSPGLAFDVASHSLDASSCNDHATASDENSVPQNHAQSTLGESTSMVDSLGGMNMKHAKRRTFTLEDATDAILFCRSIITNIAYEAADIAIEKDTCAPLEEEQVPLQHVVVRKSSPNRTDLRLTRRRPKSQKTKQKRDSDSKQERDHPAAVVIREEEEEDDDEKRVDVSSTNRIVGANTVKPPKLESKCNCVIM